MDSMWKANSLLHPQAYISTVYDIPFKFLYQKGFKNILFDIDNTLAPFIIPKPPKSIVKLLKYVESLGFSVMLISNNQQQRVDIFVEDLDIPSVARAKKPLTSFIKKAIDALDMSPEETIFVGDQIFTDVFCANLLGMYPILVKPLSTVDEWSVKPKRNIEKKCLQKYIEQCTLRSLKDFTIAPITATEKTDNFYGS